MSLDIENFLDAYAIAAPQIFSHSHYRRSLARLVMTVLMMREDRKIRTQEVELIKKIARAKFDLDEKNGQALCDELCADNEHEPSLDELVAYIKENSTPIECADCIREMWEIAVCDNELHVRENKFAQRCGKLLGVDMDEVTWLKELAVVVHSDDGNAAS
ncbi:MAG: TerB family tellurite resistance protein [Hyphomicrobiales bacterium]